MSTTEPIRFISTLEFVLLVCKMRTLKPLIEKILIVAHDCSIGEIRRSVAYLTVHFAAKRNSLIYSP